MKKSICFIKDENVNMCRMCIIVLEYEKVSLHGPSMLADRPIFVTVSLSIQLLSVLWKHLVISQFSKTPLSFVTTMKLYEVSLVIINRQTLYDSGILRHDYGIIRGWPIGSSSG